MARGPLAGASGPGKFSARTDSGTPEMKLGSIAYGEGKETQAIKSGAPLASTPDVRPSPVTAPTPEAPVTSLFAETQRPSEPITAGVDVGMGPGSNALMLGKTTEKLSDTLAKLLPFDTTGEITILYQQAASRGL